MRKNNGIKAVALSTALTMALLAGCTNKSITKESDQATEADTKETVTTASAEENTVAATTVAVATTAEDETKDVETTEEQEEPTTEGETEVEAGTAEDVSTAAPEETTAAPVETTAAPVETTAAPVETTVAPVETTAAPVETTAAPVETTAAPLETTAAPVETTAAPVETTEAPEETTAEPETAPVVASYDVRIVNWWQGEDEAPRTKYEKALWAYREQIQKDHNFTIHVDNIGGWGESYTTQLSASITAGDPIGQVCILEPSWFAALMNNNLMKPLETLPSLDLSKPKWNQGIFAATTYGGHVYGLPTVDEGGNRFGVYFNKRLLQEAGYSADALYDFQKSGTWNWSKFEEVLKACTRDADNDGVIDHWGMTCFSTEYYTAAIYSSGAEFVTKDASGKFVNQAKSAQFRDTLCWANEMWQKYAQPCPEGDTWDYFKASFNRGEAAMRVAQDYVATELWPMSDEWGFVMFPAPDGQEPITLQTSEVAFIPSSYSTEEADRIAFAYDLYTDPVPGYDSATIWKQNDMYVGYYDSKAIGETLARMRSGKTKECLHYYVYGFEDQIGSGFIWDMAEGSITPDEAIQAKMAAWNACIKEQNNALKLLK